METVFTTSVYKEFSENLSTKKVIDGKEVTVTETIKVNKPVKISLQKPGRRISEAAEIYYAKSIAFYIKEGLLSLYMLSKRYDNDGGPFNDLENNILEKLSEQKFELSKEYWAVTQKEVKTEEDKKKEADVLKEVSTLQQRIDQIQNPYINIYNQTAEFKARNRAVSWWLLHLLHVEKDGKTERLFPGKDIFKDEDLEKQLDLLSEMSVGKDAFLKEVVRKSTYFISCWAGGAVFTPADDKEESIKNAEKTLKSAEDSYDLEFPEYPIRKVEKPVEATPEKPSDSQPPLETEVAAPDKT